MRRGGQGQTGPSPSGARTSTVTSLRLGRATSSSTGEASGGRGHRRTRRHDAGRVGHPEVPSSPLRRTCPEVWRSVLLGMRNGAVSSCSRFDAPLTARLGLVEQVGADGGIAVGARWDEVDLDRGTLSVQRTIVRMAGVGLVARTPKTRAGVRVLGLPGWLVDLLRARQVSARSAEEPLFPDALGGYRDRNNVEAAFRAVRAGTAFEWLVPHTYRKTVATWMDAEGLSARTIADKLGHSRISMTQDVYMGRRAVDASAARVLQAVELPPRISAEESA